MSVLAQRHHVLRRINTLASTVALAIFATAGVGVWFELTTVGSPCGDKITTPDSPSGHPGLVWLVIALTAVLSAALAAARGRRPQAILGAAIGSFITTATTVVIVGLVLLDAHGCFR